MTTTACVHRVDYIYIYIYTLSLVAYFRTCLLPISLTSVCPSSETERALTLSAAGHTGGDGSVGRIRFRSLFCVVHVRMYVLIG